MRCASAWTWGGRVVGFTSELPHLRMDPFESGNDGGMLNLGEVALASILDRDRGKAQLTAELPSIVLPPSTPSASRWGVSERLSKVGERMILGSPGVEISM
jgi:hypothetical protein